MLEYVNKHGKSSSSLKSFSKDFGRSFGSISRRIYRLESGNEYDTNNKSRAWEFEEDEKLVNFFFKLKNIKSANISSLKISSRRDFEEIAKELKRSTSSVYDHWHKFVIPCLKPHLKQLASSNNFKKDILRHIEEGYVKTVTLKGYSEADDKFIIQQIQKYGYEPGTFVKIAKKIRKERSIYCQEVL